ncbi:hypothetical protein EON64_12355 [archaeon]|nr:MAG: hypothetical protein EON64_12355 [archaeon]
MVDVSSEAWSKQEAAVLYELNAMGLAHKPLVTVLNKVDLLSLQDRQLVAQLAAERADAVPLSARTLEELERLADALRAALTRQMWQMEVLVRHSQAALVSRVIRLGCVGNVAYSNHYVRLTASVPIFLLKQLQQLEREDEEASAAGLGCTAGLYDPEQANSVFMSMEDVYEEEGVFMPRARVLWARQQQSTDSGALGHPPSRDEGAVDWRALAGAGTKP